MKAGTIMNFPKVGQPLIFYVLVVTFTCLCCFSAAEAEDCYRGLDFVDFPNPCSDQPGQPAMYPLCPKGQKSEERCTGRCDYCREGTYQDVFTNCMTCLDCITAADCPSGQVIIQNCTRNSNAVCGCPPSPPCSTCPSCPPVTPCPSITPCPIQTECPACECPTDVPVTTDHQEPSYVVLTRECPADILAVAASGSKVTSVEWEEPQATEGAIILQSHHPNDSFVVGNTTVIYVFRQGSQVENCSFAVTVVEESAPHTTPPGTVEPSDGNISDSGALVDCGTDYHKILLIISGVLNLIFIVVLCLIVWKTGLWKGGDRLSSTDQPPEDDEGIISANPPPASESGSLTIPQDTARPDSKNDIEMGLTVAKTECNDLRDAEGENTVGNGSVSSTTQFSNAGGDRLSSTDQPPDVDAFSRLTSTDQPPDIEGLNSADSPPANANLNSDVANHSGDAVYGRNGDDDATDSTRPLLTSQTSSSTVPDDFDPAQLINSDKVGEKVQEQEIRWLAAMVNEHFPDQLEILYSRLGISKNAITRIKRNSSSLIESEVFAVVNYGWRDTENPIGEGRRSHLIKQLYTFDKNLAKTYANFINNCKDFSIMYSTALLPW